MNKKRLAVLTAMIVSVFSLKCAASNVDFSQPEECPSGWSVKDDKTDNASLLYDELGVSDTLKEKVMILSCDSRGNAAESKITAASPQYEPDGNIYVRLRAAANNPSDNRVVRRFRLVDASGAEKELFRITNNTVRFLSISATDVEITSDKLHDFEFAINAETGEAAIWLDGELKSTEDTGLTEDSLEKISFTLVNAFSSRAAYSTFSISELEVGTTAAFAPVAQPQNGQTFVDAKTVNSVTVDFGAVMTYKSLSEENVSVLDGDSTPVDFDIERQSGRVVLSLKEALEPQSSYSVSFTSLTDVFGNTYEPYTISFTTAPDSYTAAESQITVPSSGAAFPINHELSVTAEVTVGSSQIALAELLVNGEVKDSVSGAPFKFSFTPTETAELSLSVRITDSDGGITLSPAVTVNTYVNKAPTVRINASDGDTVSPGDFISYEAQDEDGTVESVQLYLGDELIKTTTDAVGSFEIPSEISFGGSVIRAVAYDEYEDASEASVNVLISRSGVQTLANENFSFFNQGRTGSNVYFGNVLGVTNGGTNYIISDTIDSEKAYIIGSDVHSTGAAGYLSYTFPEASNIRKMKVDMRMLLDSAQSHHGITLRMFDSANSDAVVFIEDITFADGKITYKNGSAQQMSEFSISTWHDIELELDLDEGKYSLTLDGVLLADNFSFSRSTSNLRLNVYRVSFTNQCEEGEDAPARLAFSKFKITCNYVYPYISNIEFSPENKKELTIRLGSLMEPEKFIIGTASVFMEDKAVSFEKPVLSSDKASLKLTLKNDYRPNCDYTVNINFTDGESDSKMSFTAAAPNDELLGVSNASFNENSGRVSFTADMRGTNEEVLIILTQYNKDGAMTGCVWESAAPSGQTQVTTPEIAHISGSTYKACVRSSWTSLLPVSYKIYSYNLQ